MPVCSSLPFRIPDEMAFPVMVFSVLRNDQPETTPAIRHPDPSDTGFFDFLLLLNLLISLVYITNVSLRSRISSALVFNKGYFAPKWRFAGGIQSWVECMGALTLRHSVQLSSECISECGTFNSAELNLCCNIHSVQLSRGEGLHSAHLSISNFPLELLLICISRLIFSARSLT